MTAGVYRASLLKRNGRNLLPAVASCVIASALASALGSGLAWAATRPTSKVFGWGVKEHWIVCSRSHEACNRSPYAVPGLTKIVRLDASDVSNLAIDASGHVWGWGDNERGELGDGTTKPRAIPVKARGVDHVVQTATGNSDAVALKANGRVWAWGNNVEGQLGTGNLKSHLVPVPATAVNSYTSKHRVSVKQLAAGGNKAYALLSNGTVIAWGGNEFGDLGDGRTGGRSLTPVVVSRLPSNIVAISSGNLFGDALTSTGAVYDWGNNAHGQLGDGRQKGSPVAVRVTHLTDGRSSRVVKISAGGDLPANGHNMALLADGTVMTWGDNADGQLGDGKTVSSNVPVAVTRLSDGKSRRAVSIGAGGSHSMALLSDGTVMTWGDNSHGQLGDGKSVKSTVPVKALTACEMISAGANDSLAARRPKG